MIDCPNGEVRDALPDYLNERLEPARMREVESHLAGCGACRDELSLLRTLRATLRRAPVVHVEAIAARIPPYRAPARRRWVSNGRVAAAIAVIAVGGTSVALLRGRTVPTPVEVAPRVVVVPVPSPDSPPAISAPSATDAPIVGSNSAPHAAGRTAVRELAIAGGTIADLSDRELSALVEGIESLDGLPSAEVETPEPVSMPPQEGT